MSARRSMPPVPARISEAKKSRVWFYRPQLYWFGWKTLLPFDVGHDEFSRQTIVLGWTLTGRAVIAVRYCGNENCYESTLEFGLLDE